MIKSRKGQLSIETMIIYGLIALVALSAVAALIYFDVLNLGRYLPDRCDIGGSGDLKCEEVKVSGTSIELGVRNVAQKPIEGLAIYATESAGIHLSAPTNVVLIYDAGTTIIKTNPIAPGEIVRVVLSGNVDIKSNQVLEATLRTTYKYIDGAIMQQASGDMRVKAS